jgi:2,5-diamino-6-(ribosylamino)-4(3H)-pyrimidinone 5'-phosphate reductase
LSTKFKEKLERIQKLLQRLATESTKGIPIIVEGPNDEKALRELCISGEIISAKTFKSFIHIISAIEEHGQKEVILLMDFDRRGREWTRRFVQNLERMRVKPNVLFWNGLLNLAGREIKDIEGLASYMKTLEKKSGLDDVSIT